MSRLHWLGGFLIAAALCVASSAAAPRDKASAHGAKEHITRLDAHGMHTNVHVVKDHGPSSSHGGSNHSEHSAAHSSGRPEQSGQHSPAHHESSGNAHLVAHGGGGGGGHSGFGGGGGGGH